MSRYSTRAKIILDGASGQKLPEDEAVFKNQVGVAAPLLVPSAAASTRANDAAPSALGGTAAGSMEDEDDGFEEELEAALLGLENSGNPKKRKSKDGKDGKTAKKMRTKDEVFNEEANLLETEVQAMISKLSEFPRSPSGYEIGMLDRRLNTKMKAMRESSYFGGVTRLEGLQKTVKAVRDCCKAATSYLPARGLPAKKHQATFFSTFEKGMVDAPDAASAFPAAVLHHYNELLQEKEINGKNWTNVASNLGVEKISKIFEGEEGEKQSIAIVEKSFDAVLEMSEFDEAVSSLVELCEKILLAKPVPALEVQLPLIIQLCQLDTKGAATLDGLITELNNQKDSPITRVLYKKDIGMAILDKAADHNATLQEKATKLTTVQNLKEQWVGNFFCTGGFFLIAALNPTVP